jgi:DMSO/TMAO reductase YedYZ molybdopterin-dependent catalytic subunit
MRRHARLAPTFALIAIVCALQLPALADPAVPPAAPTRSLAITGGVERKLDIGAEELAKRPAAQIVALQLPGKEGGRSTVRGVRLRDLVDEAKVVTRDHHTVKKLVLIAAASDGYKVVFTWSELFNTPVGDGVLVLFERDGKPLGPNEGPLALISAKDLRTGPRHVKWLQSVEVRQIVD